MIGWRAACASAAVKRSVSNVFSAPIDLRARSAHRSLVDAARDPVVVGPGLAEVLLEKRQCLRLEIAAVTDAEPFHLGAGHRTNPVKLADRQSFDEGRAHPGRDDEQSIGLALVGSHLGQKLVIRDAGGRREPGLGADSRPNLFGDLGRRRDLLQVFGDVEIGLIERQRLDQSGVYSAKISRI